MKRLRSTLKELTAYPSAVVGLVIVIALVGISIFTLIALPYDEAVRLWRGGEEVWYNYPKTAGPAWTNIFRRQSLPATIIVSTEDGTVEKTINPVSEEMTAITYSFVFDYPTMVSLRRFLSLSVPSSRTKTRTWTLPG